MELNSILNNEYGIYVIGNKVIWLKIARRFRISVIDSISQGFLGLNPFFKMSWG